MPHPGVITTNDIRSPLGILRSGVSAKTVAGVQLGRRRFSRFLLAESAIDHDPTASMKLISHRVEPRPIYSTSEVAQLLRGCQQSTPTGVCDATMITVLFDTGVRAGELVSMGVPDWDARTVVVDGKSSVRTVPLGDASLFATQLYVRRSRVKDGQDRKADLTVLGVLQAVKWKDVTRLRRYTVAVSTELAQLAH